MSWTSPIDRIPDVILSDILCYAYQPSYPKSPNGITNALCVSRRWKHIAFNTVSLWTKLDPEDLHDAGKFAIQKEKIRDKWIRYLSRSGTASNLDLQISSGFPSSVPSMRDTILDTATRCRAFDCHMDAEETPNHYPEMWQYICDASSTLVDLKLSCWPSNLESVWEGEEMVLVFDSITLPVLKTLHLEKLLDRQLPSMACPKIKKLVTISVQLSTHLWITLTENASSLRDVVLISVDWLGTLDPSELPETYPFTQFRVTSFGVAPFANEKFLLDRCFNLTTLALHVPFHKIPYITRPHPSLTSLYLEFHGQNQLQPLSVSCVVHGIYNVGVLGCETGEEGGGELGAGVV